MRLFSARSTCVVFFARWRYWIVVVCLGSTVGQSVLAAGDGSYTAKRRAVDSTVVIIDAVEVARYGVFPPSAPESAEWYASAANRLHVATRQAVIRRELLFAPGDTLSEALLERTERNLRQFAFLDSVAVSSHTEDGKTTVTIYTDDNWTLGGGLIFQGGGGRRHTGAEIIERNLFGLGKDLRATYVHLPEAEHFSMGYVDPQVAGTRWQARVSGMRTGLGNLVRASLNRTFYARHVEYSGGVDVWWSSGQTRLVRNSASGLEPIEQSRGSGYASRAWGLGEGRLVIRSELAIESSQWPDARPFERGAKLDTLGLPWESVTASTDVVIETARQWFALRRIDRFGRREDAAAGTIWSFGFGVIREIRMTPYVLNPFLRSSVSRTSRWKNSLAVLDGSATISLLDDPIGGDFGWSHASTDAAAHFYYQGLPRQTLAAAVRYRAYIRDFRRNRWFYVGGLSGLRGYPAWQFGGRHSLSVNIEDRVFTPIKIITVALGFVVFADAGYSWRDGGSVDLRDLMPSVGVGVRLGHTKSATPVTRFDVALPLRGGFGVGINYGVGQSFGK